MKLATPENKFSIGDCRLPIFFGGERKSFSIAKRKSQSENGFTLVEVLAALLFLAIVIPTVIEALHVATLSGEVAVRKSAAARVADRVLNESIVMTNWNSGTQSGTVSEGAADYNWTLTSQAWPQDSMQLLTAEVKYSAQGKDYSVKLSTLADPQSLNGTVNLQQ